MHMTHSAKHKCANKRSNGRLLFLDLDHAKYLKQRLACAVHELTPNTVIFLPGLCCNAVVICMEALHSFDAACCKTC